MADIDIEKLAREAGVAYVDPETYVLCPSIREGCDMRPELRAFAALVLEEAATKAESSVAEFGVNSEWTHGYVEGVKDCASGLRTIAEGLKP